MRLRLVTRIRFQYWTPILGALGKPNQISEVTHLGNLFGALLRSQGPLPHHCKPFTFTFFQGAYCEGIAHVAGCIVKRTAHSAPRQYFPIAKSH